MAKDHLTANAIDAARAVKNIINMVDLLESVGFVMEEDADAKPGTHIGNAIYETVGYAIRIICREAGITEDEESPHIEDETWNAIMDCCENMAYDSSRGEIETALLATLSQMDDEATGDCDWQHQSAPVKPDEMEEE